MVKTFNWANGTQMVFESKFKIYNSFLQHNYVYIILIINYCVCVCDYKV